MELYTHIFEHILKLEFWILGSILLAWWSITKDPDHPSRHRGPRATALLRPHLTTEDRKTAAIAAFVAALAGMIQQGYWVAMTMWRLNLLFSMLRSTSEEGSAAEMLWVVVSGVVLAVTTFLIWEGASVVGFQIDLIADLVWPHPV